MPADIMARRVATTPAVSRNPDRVHLAGPENGRGPGGSRRGLAKALWVATRRAAPGQLPMQTYAAFTVAVARMITWLPLTYSKTKR